MYAFLDSINDAVVIVDDYRMKVVIVKVDKERQKVVAYANDLDRIELIKFRNGNDAVRITDVNGNQAIYLMREDVRNIKDEDYSWVWKFYEDFRAIMGW